MTIKFILEVYVYGQRLLKNVKLYGSMVSFYGQDQGHVPLMGCRLLTSSKQLPVTNNCPSPTSRLFFFEKISDLSPI